MPAFDNDNPPFPDDDVDPEVRTFLTRMFASSAAIGAEMGLGDERSVAQRRAIAERQREPWTRGGPEMASTTELTVGPSNVRVRLHRPSMHENLPVLVYLHGGGWTLFSLDTHDRLMREYAGRAGCAVLGIDYSLSPEHRFPRALQDIAEVLNWLDAEGDNYGINSARHAIGGDSAGANLSVSAAIMRRDSGKVPARALLLNYGAFDGAHRPSYERYGDGDRYMLTGPEMDDFWSTYLGDETDADPLARPLHADLAGLPPCYLCVAQCDVLLDENIIMADLLRGAGVDADLRIYEGATHSFLEAVEISRLADLALQESSDWLASQLA